MERKKIKKDKLKDKTKAKVDSTDFKELNFKGVKMNLKTLLILLNFF